MHHGLPDIDVGGLLLVVIALPVASFVVAALWNLLPRK